eukprot:5258027-Amphidinium_carterae.1
MQFVRRKCVSFCAPSTAVQTAGREKAASLHALARAIHVRKRALVHNLPLLVYSKYTFAGVLAASSFALTASVWYLSASKTSEDKCPTTNGQVNHNSLAEWDDNNDYSYEDWQLYPSWEEGWYDAAYDEDYDENAEEETHLGPLDENDVAQTTQRPTSPSWRPCENTACRKARAGAQNSPLAIVRKERAKERAKAKTRRRTNKSFVHGAGDPNGADGQVLRCSICGSTQHLRLRCPLKGKGKGQGQGQHQDQATSNSSSALTWTSWHEHRLANPVLNMQALKTSSQTQAQSPKSAVKLGFQDSDKQE